MSSEGRLKRRQAIQAIRFDRVQRRDVAKRRQRQRGIDLSRGRGSNILTGAQQLSRSPIQSSLRRRTSAQVAKFQRDINELARYKGDRSRSDKTRREQRFRLSLLYRFDNPDVIDYTEGGNRAQGESSEYRPYRTRLNAALLHNRRVQQFIPYQTVNQRARTNRDIWSKFLSSSGKYRRR